MEIVYTVAFYIIVIIAVLSAIVSVLCKKVVYSVISAFISLLMTGLLLISLGFSYLGAVQIALSSAIALILAVFSVQFVRNRDEFSGGKRNIVNTFLSVTGVSVLLISITASFKAGFFDNVFNNILLPFTVSNNSFAENLFINYGASFIFSSLIFLSAVLGVGVILAEKDVKGDDE